MHGVFINGTTGEWFSQTPEERRLVAENAIDAGRRAGCPVVIGCTSLHGARGGRARPPRDRGGRRRDRLDAAAVLEDVPRRDRRVLPGHLATAVDAPLMVYNWPHGTSVDIGADLAERLVDDRQRRRDQGLARRTSTQFFETTKRGRRPGVRVFGPFMSRGGARAPARGTAATASSAAARSGARATPSSGRRSGAATSTSAREHARRTDELFPKLWLPGGWGGALRRLPEPAQGADADARPAGRTTVRPPRLPVTDEASIAAHARDPRRGRAAGASRRRSRERLPGSRPRRRRRRRHRRGDRRSTAARSASTASCSTGPASSPGWRRTPAGRRAPGSRCSRTAAPRRSAPGASSSCRCSTATGRRPCRRARPGARSACARSASTSAASPRCTRASSPPAARS